jgi:hypothetical protein
MKPIRPSRKLCGAIVTLAALFAAPCLAQKLETSVQEISCSKSNDLLSGYQPRYRALREFKDPGTHQDWLLIRDLNQATGPALLVRESPHSCASFTLEKVIRGSEFQLQVRPMPVIHTGDQIIILEHTTLSDAALEATALEAAAPGDALLVRIKFGGLTVRAIAAAPGRATLGSITKEWRP